MRELGTYVLYRMKTYDCYRMGELTDVSSALVALVSKKIVLRNNVCYRMKEITEVLSDYVHYSHLSFGKFTWELMSATE
ncbi:hypothetical protein CDAR_249481 [Caerostris darwini]|uniref:Uncharacterized protein n=1 Tax=Caerostris darwini TaxID=1538125 RepID=A0AAV4TPS9_9ARAC|nr:hypothetical protein CDAR_249481 [Caerostris darwini]